MKTGKNARNSAKFKHRKFQIKIWKVMFCDTYTQRKKTLRNFSGKIFRQWRLTLMCSDVPPQIYPAVWLWNGVSFRSLRDNQHWLFISHDHSVYSVFPNASRFGLSLLRGYKEIHWQGNTVRAVHISAIFVVPCESPCCGGSIVVLCTVQGSYE